MESVAVFDLEKYKTAPVEANLSELAKINSKLEELAKDCFPVEEEARQELLHQKALYTYPKLDTGFLSLSAEREWEHKDSDFSRNINIKVPRFSVHRLDEPEMIMRFGRNWKFRNDYTAEINSPENLVEIISIPLLKGIEFFDDDSIQLYVLNEEKPVLRVSESISNLKPLKETLKKYKDIGGMVEIQRSFSGLIPQKNKRTIREAQKIFGDEIFLIAEAKPEDWNVRRYITDPIVAGVINEDCFYIDKFNTTPLEEYVKTGFSQTN